MSEGTPGFECELRHEGDGVRVVAAGELDAATADLLSDRIEAGLRERPRRLILDLAGLTFMASAGLRIVLRLVERAADDGFELGVVPGSDQVRRIFELTRTDGRVPWLER